MKHLKFIGFCLQIWPGTETSEISQTIDSFIIDIYRAFKNKFVSNKKGVAKPSSPKGVIRVSWILNIFLMHFENATPLKKSNILWT